MAPGRRARFQKEKKKQKTYMYDFVSEFPDDGRNTNAGLEPEYVAHLRPALEDLSFVYLVPERQGEPLAAVQLPADQPVQDQHGVLVLEKRWRQDHDGVLGVVDGVGARLGFSVEFDAVVAVFEFL